jgi:Fic family protein
VLEALRQVARIQSTEASNAIEDITAPSKRIEALVAEKSTPANRSEEEIAGYRYVLDTIHASALDIPFKRTVVEQFHRDLYRFTSVRAGRFKIGSNEVTEQHPDGTVVVRFKPVDPAVTPLAIDELHERFDRAWHAEEHHRLLLIGSYIFDFLMIHPFQDGNGRMSRLLTLLLLYHAGYEVGRFVSLERIINDSRETYYESLQASTRGWHDAQHDIKPWLSYFLGTILAAHKEFEERVGAIGNHGAKGELVKSFVRSALADTFTFDDVRRAAPGVSDVYIGKILRELRDCRVLRSEGTGRGARWHRLTTDF